MEQFMKRIMKRILPILLGLVIICSIVWYLFSYDRGFMQDVLLSSARYFEERGNHGAATWLYNQAYLHSGNDDGVIIELAERFKKIGNYTQAEVVLTNAIKEGGSADLYIALSRTYVEQDKLMDAVEMLENITNPEIKAQLDAQRPAAPVAAPVSGYYTQYLNVTIEVDDGAQLYVVTGKDFPSIQNAYQGGIQLTGGENKINAIAVDENGLVSTPAYFSYVVGGVIEEVEISDPVLDSCFREILNLTPTDKLFSDDLWRITSLQVPDGVEDYSDLSLLTFLDTLVMEEPNLNGLQMLSSMTQLKNLFISGCPLSAADLSIIGALPNLESLILNNCSLSNISGLSNASRLVNLDLRSNAISDLSPLSFLEHLSVVNLSSNALTNISPLSALENLTALDVSYNSLTSVAPLATCLKLNTLVATNNKLAEIPVFNNPSVLTTLDLASNDLTDVSALSNYISLSGLSIAYNQVSDVSSLAALNQLTYVDISHNMISALPAWSKSCALVELNASYNKLTSVSALRGLAALNYVNLDHNKLSNINPLADCRMLVRVSVFGNYVKDVSKLTEMSVIVNYDPT
ncbi:MAG: leucine-rich repeat domain-containing protein [Ruminococcaceae bacterium]|nr:leucine-rich repeat domain-containing protein [Oscillospiraceae bacterium]